jgi:hypothetical protein
MSPSIQRLLKMQRFTRAAKRHHRNRYGRRHLLDRPEIVAGHHAVSVNGIQYQLPSAKIDSAPSQLDDIWGQVRELDADPSYAAALKALEANGDCLRSMLLGDFLDQPRPPERAITATELVSAMRKAMREMSQFGKSPAYRDWREDAAREIRNQLEIRSALMWRGVYIQQDQLIDPARLVNFNLLTC